MNMRSPAISGALYMVSAGLCFTVANVCTRHVTFGLGLSSTVEAFIQYFIAFVFALPMVMRQGWSGLRTSRPWAHVARVLLSVLGVQAFVFAFASGVPMGQVIALVMTAPFFIILGAAVFLREKVLFPRWLATGVAFLGALLILRPWAQAFSVYAWAPLLAAVCWGSVSLLTKSLLHKESPSTVTVWLLLLMSPVNLGFALVEGFQWPTASMWLFLVGSGLSMTLAQYLLTKSYQVADAAYVQPFDGFKLPLNFLAGWMVFGDAFNAWMWGGAALILAASFYNVRYEMRSEQHTP